MEKTITQKAADRVLAYYPIVLDTKKAKECALHEIAMQIELLYQINRSDLLSETKAIQAEIEKLLPREKT